MDFEKLNSTLHRSPCNFYLFPRLIKCFRKEILVPPKDIKRKLTAFYDRVKRLQNCVSVLKRGILSKFAIKIFLITYVQCTSEIQLQ